MNAPVWPPHLRRDSVGFEESRLRFQPLSASNALELLELAQDSAAEIDPWMRWTDGVVDVAAAAERIAIWEQEWERGERYAFAARESVSGRMVGGGGLGQFNLKNRFGNLAYWVRTPDRGRGHGPRIARAVSRFGIHALGMLRVEILMEPINTSSRRVAEKAGAVSEGTLRQRILNGEPRTALLFSFRALLLTCTERPSGFQARDVPTQRGSR